MNEFWFYITLAGALAFLGITFAIGEILPQSFYDWISRVFFGEKNE